MKTKTNNVLIDKYSVREFMNEFSIYSKKHGGLCKIPYSDLKGDLSETQAKQNADLIVTALNSCKSINPDNPLAVATALPELFKTIEYIKRNCEKINEHTWKTYKEQILGHIEDIEAMKTATTI